MIRDLQQAGRITSDCEVLVIGAGTAGLVIAEQLYARGIKVICIESGGMRQDEDEHPLNAVEYARSVYDGAAHGRFRCLGGTSTRWGGALIPFAAGDMDPTIWPVSHDDILAYQPAVEHLFGLNPGSYRAEEIIANDNDHVARLAKWPPFANRNVAHLLDAKIRSDAGPEIWLNATATRFCVEDGALQSVTASAPDGASLTIKCRIVIVAAGAIETTRLLLLADAQNDTMIAQKSPDLGRYFHDHLSVVVGYIDKPVRRKLNKLAGFRFEAGGVMRNLRFELSDGSALRDSIPACFAHIGFEDQQGSGFDALRELFRFLQQRRLPPVSVLVQLVRATPWLLRAIWWRLVERRLLYPDNAQIQVHMVIEQQPEADSRISLSSTQSDAYGQPLARLSWAPSGADCANLTKATDAFEALWQRSELKELGSFIRRGAGEAERELAHGSGIYHPGGSTRMAASADRGVVDCDLRVFALPNVRAVATSVLPTGGGANPTMTLMMLAMRCVESVVQEIKGGSAKDSSGSSSAAEFHERVA